MKYWKIIVLILGILLLVASAAVYVSRIASCYPSPQVWAQFTTEYQSGFRQACQLDAAPQVQFTWFLVLFIPGILLFTTYWLFTRPAVKVRRGGMLAGFMFLMMLDSLIVAIFALISYPIPGNTPSLAAWVVDVIAALSLLSYISILALWHWKRWGLYLFQFASVSLAVFVLLGGRSLILAGIMILGLIILTLVLRPVRNKLV
jgi:hypothetical protein